MYDQLKYRIPGAEIVKDKGAFKRVASFEGVSGFVISDFLQEQLFSFDSKKSVSSGETIFNEPLVLSKEEYINQGNRFLKELRKNNLGKAVFSRIKEVPLPLNGKEMLFDSLCDAYPKAFVYEVVSHEFGHWIGASPEKLLEGKKGDFQTTSLASTKKTGDPSPWEPKEIEEQALVTKFIENQLNRIDVLYSMEEKTELIAGPVKHLQTNFNSIKENNALLLLKELHPTPAVSGLPRQEAIRLINDIEKHDRSLYTGFIGLLKENVNMYVNLRCLQLIGDKAYLYLGGGYTKDSVVEKEWEETENKARTLIKVMENL